jgi:hypothetical protein
MLQIQKKSDKYSSDLLRSSELTGGKPKYSRFSFTNIAPFPYIFWGICQSNNVVEILPPYNQTAERRKKKIQTAFFRKVP